MSKALPKEAGRISADTLAAAAAQGVQRALAARATMTELSPEQTAQVSGAVTATAGTLSPTKLRPPIIYGLWYPIEPVALTSVETTQL